MFYQRSAVEDTGAAEIGAPEATSKAFYISGSDAGYSDSESCIPCHQQIWETYRHTGMGRSFFRPRSENMAEDFESEKPFHHAASERYYTMYERSGKYHQRRHQIGFGGKETNVVEKEIHFVMGSGNHLRNCLHLAGDGTLYQLPVAWYTERMAATGR